MTTFLSTPYIDWSNPIQRNAALGQTKSLVNSFGSNNPMDVSQSNQLFSSTVLPGSTSTTKGSFLKNIGTGIVGGLGSMGTGMLLDAAGAIAGGIGKAGGNLISGGLESGAGKTIQGITSGIGDIVGNVPIVGGLAKGALNLVGGITGGITNALFGSKINTENVDKIISNNSNLVQAGKDLAKSTSTSSLLNNAQSLGSGISFSNKFIGKDGWFSNKAEKKAEQLRRAQNKAVAFQDAGLAAGVRNVDANTDDAALGNTLAIGGPLFNSIEGALDYGFMSDYISSKRQENAIKNKMAGLSQMPIFMPQGFAFGGNTQTNGADFPTGLVHIQAGGSHESNPNDGVQLGVDQNNVPNLVEEGETVYDDYVYSNRILADEATKKLFHLPKKRDISYADISKRLEKEAKERPNDPISQKGLEAQMHKLAEQQERQKQEMEAKRAKAAFDALSPEEQTAIMQQRAVQEQAAMEQQAQMQADGTEAIVGEEPQQFAEGGDTKKKKNVGSWKNDKENHWDIFTRPGLKRFIENLKAQLNMAPDEEAKDRIRRQAMNELNTLQQSYYDYVRDGAANSTQGYSDNILNHQKMFDKLYGNTGFYSKDNEGNVKNLIAEAINLPNGAATDDKPDNWFDGYNGPRTSIRNFGSTAYGDDKYYQDLVDEFKGLGLSYAPNDNWKDDNGILYGLSIPEAESAKSEAPKVWDWNTGDWIEKPAEDAGKAKVVTTPSPSTPPAETEDLAPKRSWEGLRYAGLFGPAVGLGMMAAGIGKPDTESINAAVEGAGDVRFADYKPIGNYLAYRPLDIWYEQNRLNANARATDRAILNSGANQGSKMAGLLAAGYNDQIASGNLFRQAQEYNDALREKVANFNRGTDQFNSEQYGATSRFNAGTWNDANRAARQLKLQAASQKADMDAGWYNSLYGNVSGLFKGLGDLGTENKRDNMINWMLSKGIYGTVDPNDPEMKKRVKVVKKSE